MPYTMPQYAAWKTVMAATHLQRSAVIDRMTYMKADAWQGSCPITQPEKCACRMLLCKA